MDQKGSHIFRLNFHSFTWTSLNASFVNSRQKNLIEVSLFLFVCSKLFRKLLKGNRDNRRISSDVFIKNRISINTADQWDKSKTNPEQFDSENSPFVVRLQSTFLKKTWHNPKKSSDSSQKPTCSDENSFPKHFILLDFGPSVQKWLFFALSTWHEILQN